MKNILFRVILAGALLGLPVTARAGTERLILIGGRTNYLYLPSSLNRRARYPLVFCVHYADSYRAFAGEYADSKNVLILATDYWSPAVYTYLTNKYPVDPDRVYLTGWSAGSCLVYIYSESYPDIFAAINPLFSDNLIAYRNGFSGFYSSLFETPNISPVPVRMTMDGRNAYYCYVRNLLRYTSNAETLLDDSHFITHNAEGVRQEFGKTLKFFLAHTRNRYPAEISWNGFRKIDSLYYFHHIRCDAGNGPYRIYAENSGGNLSVEVYGIRGFTIEGTDYPLLGLTNDTITVNGKALDIASHISNGGVCLPVEDPYWMDTLRTNLDSGTDVPLSIRSLVSEVGLSNTSEIYCKHTFTVTLPFPAAGAFFKVNYYQNVTAVTVDGKPVKFVKVWNLPVTEQYYRIELPAGRGSSGTSAISISTSGLAPVTLNDVPLIYQNYTSSPAYTAEYSLDRLIPVFPGAKAPFRYRVVFNVFNDDLAEVTGYTWGLYKDFYFGCNKPLTAERVSGTYSRYTLEGSTGDRTETLLFTYNPGCGTIFTNGGLTVEYATVVLYRYLTGYYEQMTNFIKIGTGDLRNVLGNPGKITLLDMSYEDCGRQAFLRLDLDNLLWDRRISVVTNNFENGGVDQNAWQTKTDSVALIGEFGSRAAAGSSFSEPVSQYLFSAGAGRLINLNVRRGMNLPYFDTMGQGVTNLETVQRYLYILSAVIPAFIPVPDGPSGVSFEQIAFRWALRKYLSYAVLEKEGYLLPRQFEVYSDAVMRTVSVSRGRLRPFAQITNCAGAYEAIPQGEAVLLAAGNRLGRDGFFAFFGKHRTELLSAPDPFGLLAELIRKDYGADYDLSALESFLLDGCPDLKAVSVSVVTNGGGFVARVKVESSAAAPVSAGLGFYSGETVRETVWKIVAPGNNEFEVPLSFMPSAVSVNDALKLLEPDSADNFIAIDRNTAALRESVLADLRDYMTDRRRTHLVYNVGLDRSFTGAYGSAAAQGRPAELVRLYSTGVDRWTAVLRFGDEVFGAFYMKQGGKPILIEPLKF